MILTFLSKNIIVEEPLKREKIILNHLEINLNNNRHQGNGIFNKQNFMWSFSKEAKMLLMTLNIVVR